MIRECRAIVLIATLLLVVSCGSAKRKVGALCQSDGECVGGLCLEGLCSALQSCQSSGDCGAGVCSEGYCWTTSCTTNDQCPSYAECNQGYCVRRASESDATDGNDSRDLSSELSCSSALDCGDRVGVLGACEIADCVNGACVKTNKPKGSSCDDGDGCTLLDECDANGLCVGSTNPCVESGNPCKQGTNAVCTSTGPTTYSCDYTQNVTNQVVCDDDDGCTTTDRCDATGACVGMGNPCVDENDPCKLEANTSCVSSGPSSYICDYGKNVTNDVGCDDGNGCTTTDRCTNSGTCVGTGDPCVEASNPCKQAANTSCTSTSETTFSCDYQKNVSNSVVCDDGNGCTLADHCDELGSCVGTSDFGAPCVSSGTNPSMCGFFGDCTEIVPLKIPVTTPKERFRVGALCQPTVGSIIAVTGEKTEGGFYGNMLVQSYSTADNATLGSPSTLSTWELVDYDSRIAALCGGNKLLVGENFQRYGLHALLVADSTGHYVEHPAMLPALDEMKNENADPIYLGRVGALRRAPNDPTGVLLATQVDDYYLSAIQRNAYLVSCAPTDGGSPPPYGCTPLPMNNLDAGADGNSWATHGLYLHIGASETKIWTLTANGRYSQSSPLTDAWRVNYFSSTDGVWSFDPNGCDGSVDTAVCHHPQRPEPSHYYGPDRRGLYAIDGFLDQLVVIVGDSLEVQVAESFPPVAASNATQLGRLILYRPSGGWSVAPPHQESQRLQPATTPALIDYVYHQVRVIDAETVLVGGYYIACYETQSGDCTKEMTSVTYGLRSFVMVFRPNAPESVAWSPMVPLDAERQLACCNHQYNSCDALPACGSQRDFWSSVPNALELYRDQQKGDIIWGLNRFVDTETEPEPHLFFFQSRLP